MPQIKSLLVEIDVRLAWTGLAHDQGAIAISVRARPALKSGWLRETNVRSETFTSDPDRLHRGADNV